MHKMYVQGSPSQHYNIYDDKGLEVAYNGIKC